MLIVIHSQFSLSPLEFGHVPAESLIYLCTGSFSFVNYMWSPCGRLQFEGFALSLSLSLLYIYIYRTSLQPLPAKADELGNGFSFSESIHVLP